MFRSKRMMLGLSVVFFGGCASGPSWRLLHQERFEGAGLITSGPLSRSGWLTAELRGGGRIEQVDGHARFVTERYPGSALVRTTRPLPPRYKLRVRLGQVRYSALDYPEAVFTDPNFKCNRLKRKSKSLENGFYWLTITDRVIEPDSGEDWWHRYRKLVIDSDDHLNDDGVEHVVRPVYMAYMNPDLDRAKGDWRFGKAALLRTWSKGRFFTADWTWEVAFQYETTDFYTVEVEKGDNTLVMRAYDGAGRLLQETTPVPLSEIYAMDRPGFAYVGEPHIDSYQGEARVDRIELYVPEAL